MKNTQPKHTKESMKKMWCPSPKGDQPEGEHGEVPAMHNEDAGPEGHRENNALSQALVKTFRANKKTADKFVLQWRMFHKLGDDPDASCSCGCSCSCS